MSEEDEVNKAYTSSWYSSKLNEYEKICSELYSSLKEKDTEFLIAVRELSESDAAYEEAERASAKAYYDYDYDLCSYEYVEEAAAVSDKFEKIRDEDEEKLTKIFRDREIAKEIYTAALLRKQRYERSRANNLSLLYRGGT